MSLVVAIICLRKPFWYGGAHSWYLHLISAVRAPRDCPAFNFESSYVDQLLYVPCYAFVSPPITNILNDVVHVGVVSNDFGLLRVLLFRHFGRFSQCYCGDGSRWSIAR